MLERFKLKNLKKMCCWKFGNHNHADIQYCLELSYIYFCSLFIYDINTIKWSKFSMLAHLNTTAFSIVYSVLCSYCKYKIPRHCWANGSWSQSFHNKDVQCTSWAVFLLVRVSCWGPGNILGETIEMKLLS